MDSETGTARDSVSRNVGRRFEALDGLLDAEAAVARREVEEADAAADVSARTGLGLRIAGIVSGRDLARQLAEGAAARLGAANDAADRISRAASALRGARASVRAAEDAGADPAMLVGVDGFWPDGDAHELPDLDRLVVIGAAISSRSSAFKAAAKARTRALEEGHDTLVGLERDRDVAVKARDRAERDGAFGELADRDRMLLGVPGVARPRRGRPLWKVLPPRFHAKDEPTARDKHARGGAEFLRMLEMARPGDDNPPAAPWPPSDEAKRTLAVSYRYGVKLVRGMLGTCWDGETRRHRLPPGIGLDNFPNQVPLISTLEGRTALASIPFVPVPGTAANLNMHELFTPETWDAITGNLVAMRGDRCCVCGAACGHMSRAGWFDRRRRGGQPQGPSAIRRIDVHEAWDFSEREDGVGVQRLVSLLPVCTDCHMVFHIDQVSRDAAGFAAWAGLDVDECREVALDYLLDRRAAMLEGVVDSPHLAAIYLAEAEGDLAGRLTEGVARDKWVVDLSGMRILNLAGGDPVLRQGVDPGVIAGLAVTDADGVPVPAASVERRAVDLATAAPREEAAPEQEVPRASVGWR